MSEQEANGGQAGAGTVDDGVFRVETIELDLPAVVGAFSQRCHAAGLPVTPERAAHLVAALSLMKPEDRRELYWLARAVFVTGPLQVSIFDKVFFEVFGVGAVPNDFDPDDVITIDKQADEAPTPETKTNKSSDAESDPSEMEVSTAPPGDDDDEDEDEDDGEELEIPIAQASEEELLAQKRFDALEPHELSALYKMMNKLKLATPKRKMRRTKKARHGEHMDMRRTLRASLRTGGDPIRLARRQRRIEPRRLVLLCDISGSMEAYARAYLQFVTSAAGSGPNSEAFVFATRLTRLTRALAGRNPERAIQRAAAAAPDWSSGTRIGDALKTFNDRHGRRGMARGAVIVILSDGWERADPELLGQEMQRLARLSYRIVWVNPRVSAEGFSPQAAGLVAALPYCDALVSGHSLKALEEVIDAIGADRASEINGRASWRPPEVVIDADFDEDEAWGSSTPVLGSSVAMPSGAFPKKGKTTPGRKI